MCKHVWCLSHSAHTFKNPTFGQHSEKNVEMSVVEIFVVVVLISKQLEKIFEFNNGDPLINVIKSVTSFA